VVWKKEKEKRECEQRMFLKKNTTQEGTSIDLQGGWGESWADRERGQNIVDSCLISRRTNLGGGKKRETEPTCGIVTEDGGQTYVREWLNQQDWNMN